jgi:hypothetical protein
MRSDAVVEKCLSVMAIPREKEKVWRYVGRKSGKVDSPEKGK